MLLLLCRVDLVRWMNFLKPLRWCKQKQSHNFPLYCLEKNTIKNLWDVLEHMAAKGTIAKEDISLVLMTDDVDEAMLHIRTYISTNYKVKPRKRSLWLLEKR